MIKWQIFIKKLSFFTMKSQTGEKVPLLFCHIFAEKILISEFFVARMQLCEKGDFPRTPTACGINGNDRCRCRAVIRWQPYKRGICVVGKSLAYGQRAKPL